MLFRAKVLTLFVLTPKEPAKGDTLFAVSILYAHCMFILSALDPSEQLFVCFGSHTKGQPGLKLRLSHWIADVIAPFYSSQSSRCPLGV